MELGPLAEAPAAWERVEPVVALGRLPGRAALELEVAQAQSLARIVEALEVGAPRGGVWGRKATERGVAIERELAQTDYKDWYNVGAERGGTFPLVDFQKGNILVSLKSVDTNGSTWLGRMKAHIRDLGTRGATVDGNPANMVLDLRVQPGGSGAASSLVPLGKRYGVTVTISEYP